MNNKIIFTFPEIVVPDIMGAFFSDNFKLRTRIYEFVRRAGTRILYLVPGTKYGVRSTRVYYLFLVRDASARTSS